MVINHREGVIKRERGGGGGQVKFYHYKRKGLAAAKVLAILKGRGGGHNTYWGSFNTGAWSFSYTGAGGDTKVFYPVKRGGRRYTKFYGGRRGGGAKRCWTCNFLILKPLPHSLLMTSFK